MIKDKKNRMNVMIIAIINVVVLFIYLATLLIVIIENNQTISFICTIIVIIISIVLLINNSVYAIILTKRIKMNNRDVQENVVSTNTTLISKNEIITNLANNINDPITIINDEISKMLINVNKPELIKNAIHKINVSSMKVNEIMSDIINVTQSEINSIVLHKNHFSISKILNNLYNDLNMKIVNKKINFNNDYKIINNDYIGDNVIIEYVLKTLSHYVILKSSNNANISLKINEASSKTNRFVNMHIEFISDSGDFKQDEIE